VRELVNHPEKRDTLLGTAFGLKLIGAIMILPILAIAVQFTSTDNYTNLLVFIIASATIFQSFNVIDLYYQATVQSKYVVLANAITLAVSSVIKIGLILNEVPLIAFAVMVVFDSVVLSLGLIYFYLKHLKQKILNFKFSRTIAVELLKDSWPLILSGLVISVYMKIDQIMIKELLDVEAVGYYSVAVRLTEVWLFITVAITTSIFPSILNAKKVSEDLYHDRILSLYRLLFIISTVIAIGLSCFSENIVIMLFGDSYSLAADILVVYAWSNIFVFLNNASWRWYLVENFQKIAMLRLALGAFVNIILNVLFIEQYGLVGAAYATLVSYSIAVYFGNLIDKRTLINFKLLTKAALTFYKIGTNRWK
jgi:O-antigen/teichoic acid export membrane protein